MEQPIEGEIGVDESGRGSIISVVVAGAVMMPPLTSIQDEHDVKLYQAIQDSKKLTAKKRDELENFIKRVAIAWGVGVIDAEEIDRINILNATYKAMHLALDQAYSTNSFSKIKVDGNRFMRYKDVGHECIIKGDAKVVNIAAASILAKTEHDRILRELVDSEPEVYGKYGIINNMGYGTKAHIEAIKMYGYTPKHRKTYKLKGLEA